MADPNSKQPQNAPGPWYVDTSCTPCRVCLDEAPNLLKYNEDETAVYFIVRRTVGGQTRRYVERLHTRVFATIADAWFLDCALQYSGAPATVISGLWHLAGEPVWARK